MKYKDVEEYIIRQLKTGQLAIGDTIESDKELSVRFGLSQLTINKALTNLANQGYLVRIRGKGTFVRSLTGNDTRKTGRFCSLSDDIRRQGMVPGSKLIEYKIVAAKDIPEIAKVFSADDEDLFHYFVRVRTADGIKIGVNYSYIAVKEVPYIDIQVLGGGSLWDFLAKKGFEGTKRAFHELKAVMPTDEQIDLLDIDKMTPLLLSHHTSMMENGRIYNYNDSYYVSERYRYKYEATIEENIETVKA